MTQVTRPLREEHQELLPHLTHIQEIADVVGTIPIASLQHELDETYGFLTHQLLPHAQAEERALYPVVGRLLDAPEATATMSRDHVEITRWVEQLGELRSHLRNERLEVSQERALRRVLYGLFALVTAHFAKEEEVYLPLLDSRLTHEEARQMFEAMEQAAREAKSVLS
jgi:iron-sulfur cluster repair protein YtfE (RIC family)